MRTSLCRCVLFVLASLVCCEATAEPRVDRRGDPLPPDALARLGTLRFRHDAPVSAVAFAPDGKFVACLDHTSRVGLWDATTGAKVWHCDLPQVYYDPSQRTQESLAFSSDGRNLLTVDAKGTISLWNVSDRKLSRRFRGFSYRTSTIVFSPDGKYLGGSGADLSEDDEEAQYRLRLWNVATGRKVLEIGSKIAKVFDTYAFSPDGKFLAVHEGRRESLPERSSDWRTVIYELATGKALFHVVSDESIVGFSPDGRYLLGENTLWDLNSGREAGTIFRDEKDYRVKAISPDGRFLASVEDTTILFYPMPRPSLPALPGISEPSPRELELLWNDLSAPEPSQSWKAMRTLMATLRQSVPFLHTKLQSIVMPEPHRVARLLADLDSDVFAERQRASEALLELGKLVVPDLRETLEDKPTLEVRQRILLLLEQIERRETSPKLLRILRVVAVLERIDNTESKALLQRLAGGTERATLTREAAAAVQRLKRHNPQP